VGVVDDLREQVRDSSGWMEGFEAVVLVGHGTAWTVLAAPGTGTAPGLSRRARLGMPDAIEVDLALRSTR
jgi:hypothetical protein